MDVGYPSSAIVLGSGEVAECDGAAVRVLLRAEPQLAAYGVAVANSELEEVRFFWQVADGSWIRVRIERRAHPAANALVTVIVEPPPSQLTRRELEVLTLMAGGLHNREIAGRLRASTRTVSTHVEHILTKLDQRSRAGAAAVAVDRGLLQLPIPGGSHGIEALAIGMVERIASDALDRPVRSPLRRRRPFLIGSAIPLSGPASADGVEMRNGAVLAIEEVNARGGIAGRSIEHVVVDADVFGLDGIRAAFERLAAAEVDAMTLGYVLTAGEDVLDVALEYGSPLLHAITSEEQLRLVRADPWGHRRVFQVCPSEVHYGRGFTRFIKELLASGRWAPRSRRVAIVETPVEGGQMSSDSTLGALDRAGWSVAAVECVPERGADWGSLVTKLLDADPDGILIASFLPEELATFQREVARRPRETLVYAVYTPSIPEYLRLAGGPADGVVWSTVTGTYADPLGSRFAGRYTQAFGRPPGRSHAGIAYDEVHLLAQAWAAVGNPRDFEAVARHLRRETYRGVNGAYFFDDDQSALAYPDMTLDPSLGQAHLVFQVQQGRHRILAPAPYAEASFQRPSWWPALAVA